MLAPFILRLVLGLVFVAHGYPKLFKNFSETAGFFGMLGLRPAKFWVLVVGVVEFFGGILLLLGLFTQAAAALIAIDMIVAMLLVSRKKGFVGGYEFDLALLAMALSLLVLGSGTFAFDVMF
ncbi:MAG: DoxX family protein [Candidatus Niyogibacteria bacterium]|nr:DoxX family protein [Candidatus Niyogibacteria bacterium]